MRSYNFIKLSLVLVVTLVLCSCDYLDDFPMGQKKIRAKLDVTCEGLGMSQTSFVSNRESAFTFGYPSIEVFYSYLRDDGYEFSFTRDITSPDDPDAYLRLVINAKLEKEFELNRKYYFATSSGWEHYVAISVEYVHTNGDYTHSITGNPTNGDYYYSFDTVGGYFKVTDRREGRAGTEIWTFEIVFTGDNVDGEGVYECADGNGRYVLTYYPELSKGRMTIEGTFIDHTIDCDPNIL